MKPSDDERNDLRQYRKKAGLTVVAVRLDLDTDGFAYEKWGGKQRCKAGDWIVNNDGDTYTVDAETFANTYEEVGHGAFAKTSSVWARKMTKGGSIRTKGGSIRTKEGTTGYEEGDYVVYNDRKGRDGYAVSSEKFEVLYKLVE